MKFYCEGEQHDNRHCENYVDQCGPCRRYQAGKMPPHYPVPAIREHVYWQLPKDSYLAIYVYAWYLWRTSGYWPKRQG